MTRKRLNHMTEKHVVSVLLNKNDLEELAKKMDPEDPISTHMDLKMDLKRIDSAFDRLPERKRERIELYLFTEMSQIEQANYFNTSQPNIKRDFLRALRAMIRLIQ